MSLLKYKTNLKKKNVQTLQSLVSSLSKMPKEKRPISSDDSDSGPEDRAPLPKSQKKSLHKVMLKLGKTYIVFRTIRAFIQKQVKLYDIRKLQPSPSLLVVPAVVVGVPLTIRFSSLFTRLAKKKRLKIQLNPSNISLIR